MPNATAVPRTRTRSWTSKLAAALVTVLAATSFAGCATRGSGTATTETRELDAFKTVDIGGAFELIVHVEPGATQRVDISGDDNIVALVEAKVSGDELEIGLSQGMIRPKQPLKVEIWIASLEQLEASGASDITVEGLHGPQFELELSGASESKLSGAVDRFEIESSGASDLQARALQAKIVDIELSGAGDAEVFASERLDVEVSGAGSVRYFGNPATVNEDVSGAGSIRPGT